MAHTPIPWRVQFSADWLFWDIRDANGIPVISCGYEGEVTVSAEDAAFIVQAVNAHQALVEALEGLRAEVTRLGYNERLSAAEARAAAALKQARGEE